jgi:hypothetical protein
MQRAGQSPLPRSSSKPPVATSPPSRSSGRAPRGDSRMAVTFVVDNDGGEDGMTRAKSSAAAPPPSSASADTSGTENLEPDPNDTGCNPPPHSNTLPSRPDCLLQPTPPLAASTTMILIASAFSPMSARLARALCRCSYPAASHPHAPVPPSPATGALKLFSLVQALAARQRRKLATENMTPFVLSFGMEEYALALQVCFALAAYAM